MAPDGNLAERHYRRCCHDCFRTRRSLLVLMDGEALWVGVRRRLRSYYRQRHHFHAIKDSETRRGTHRFPPSPSPTPLSSSRSEKVTAIKWTTWKPLKRRQSSRSDCSFIWNWDDRVNKPLFRVRFGEPRNIKGRRMLFVVTVKAVMIVLAGHLDYEHQIPGNRVYTVLCGPVWTPTTAQY